jgi:hypothetical protein
MLGQEDGIDSIAVLVSFHLVLVIFSPSSEVFGSKDDYDSLMCGLLATFLLVLGDKAVFTLTQRLRDPIGYVIWVLIIYMHIKFQ